MDDTAIDETGMTVTPKAAAGYRPASDEVWAAVRDDYLAGMSAPEASRVHGVGLSTLRGRAAREGWRRADQAWTPPSRLDPWDEGVALEERVEGNLDRVEYCELSYVATRRMMRAVMRGDATEALRWRRVRLAIDAEEAELMQWGEAQEATGWRRRNLEPSRYRDGRDDSDDSDDSDGVFDED